MPFEFGSIVLVPFPFTKLAALKQRPAVIVSSRIYSDAKPDIVIMPVTSQLRSVSSFGELLIADWQQANLLKPSIIKPVFATVEQRLIIRPLGILQAQDQAALRAAIAAVLG
jgi:mRNA interferase MazF